VTGARAKWSWSRWDVAGHLQGTIKVRYEVYKKVDVRLGDHEGRQQEEGAVRPYEKGKEGVYEGGEGQMIVLGVQ